MARQFAELKERAYELWPKNLSCIPRTKREKVMIEIMCLLIDEQTVVIKRELGFGQKPVLKSSRIELHEKIDGVLREPIFRSRQAKSWIASAIIQMLEDKGYVSFGEGCESIQQNQARAIVEMIELNFLG